MFWDGLKRKAGQSGMEVVYYIALFLPLEFTVVKICDPMIVSLQGIFPVSFLFSSSFKFPTKPDFILNKYKSFPHLFANKPQKLLGGGTRRIYLEFSLG